jgi:hypothetical protein
MLPLALQSAPASSAAAPGTVLETYNKKAHRSKPHFLQAHLLLLLQLLVLCSQLVAQLLKQLPHDDARQQQQLCTAYNKRAAGATGTAVTAVM